MASILHELRQALEHEIALGGVWVPAAPVPPDKERNAAQAALLAGTPSAPVVDEALPNPRKESPSDMEELFGEKKRLSEDPTRSPYARVEALIPEGHPAKSMTSIEEVEAYVADNIIIPLDKTRINPVFGTGDPHADLMVIGEAPGADEDKAGEPFVGRAGQLLTKILEAIGFKREEVYICNILKSRPPGNRDPEPEEVAAHIPFLYKQIALVQPKVILCVGKTAGNGLLGGRSALATLRNREHDYHGIPLYVTYHPAALLRNDQWKRPTWEDMKLLRTRYDQLTEGKDA